MAADAGPRLARLYVASNRGLRAVKGKLPRRWHRALRVVVRGVWLGLLDRRHLHWLDERFWNGDDLGFARYRDGMYRDPGFNQRGLFDWERAAIDAHFPASGRLLVTSVGGGREVVALGRMGYEIDGFECGPELLTVARDLAREHGLDADLRPVARDGCVDFGRRHHGLVVGWGSYGLIQGRERRVAFLRRLRPQVEAGAPVLLSFFTRTPGSRAFRATAAVARPLRRLPGREPVAAGDLLEPIFFHFFTEDEVRAELAAGGFELRHFATEGYGHAVGVAV